MADEKCVTKAPSPEITYVKWRTPGEELSSTALIVAHLVHERICRPRRICVAVPNDTWARNIRATLEDLDHSTIGLHAARTPIRNYMDIEDDYEWLFLTGCVNGFIPGPAAFEAASEEARAQERQRAREAWTNAFAHASKRVIASSFTKAEASFAKAAHIRFPRQKTEHGKTLAICSPTQFLQEAGSLRPTTVGGQALLRDFNLN